MALLIVLIVMRSCYLDLSFLDELNGAILLPLVG